MKIRYIGNEMIKYLKNGSKVFYPLNGHTVEIEKSLILVKSKIKNNKTLNLYKHPICLTLEVLVNGKQIKVHRKYKYDK